VEVRALDGRSLPAPASVDLYQEPDMLVDGDTLRFVMAFAFGDDGRIDGIYDQLNPHKLTRVPRLRDLRPGVSAAEPMRSPNRHDEPA